MSIQFGPRDREESHALYNETFGTNFTSTTEGNF